MCFHYIDTQISSYPLCRVESSQEVKLNQVKSVFHTMLYINTLQFTYRLACFKYFQLSIYNSQSASTRNFQLAKNQLATRNSQLIDYPNSHYDNMHAYAIYYDFHCCKKDNFQMKNFDFFSHFCSKHSGWWVHIRTTSLRQF